jgi:hypothetical protein
LITKPVIPEITMVSIKSMFAANVIVAPDLTSFAKSRAFVTKDEVEVHVTAAESGVYPFEHEAHTVAPTDSEYLPTVQLGQ